MSEPSRYPYLELGASPRDGDLVCVFRVEPAPGVTMERAADALAAESSIGTWTEVSTLGPDLVERLRARVLSIRGDLVEIAYGTDLFEGGNMAQVYSGVAGNIFGMKDVSALRLQSVVFPASLGRTFPGPAFGIPGIRKALGVFDRPLAGTIVKPKIGLEPKAQAQVVYEALRAGLDLVKDDENLTSQVFSPFEERLRSCLDACRRAEDETGQAKGYIPNVTASTEVMLRRAGQVAAAGGKFCMVDLVTCGWSGIQCLRRASLGLILHGHRAMHAAFTRSPSHGIAMAVLARSARLVGIDQIHVGTALGKMAGGADEVTRSASALTAASPDPGADEAGQGWCGALPAMPIASGGLHPGHVPGVLGLFGKDVILQFGGGVRGHPDGTAAGAKAVRQAVDAFLGGQELGESAKEFPELARALARWPNL